MCKELSHPFPPRPFVLPATIDEAVALQESWRTAVIRQDVWDSVQTVAGLDVDYGEDGRCTGAVVILRLSDLEILEFVRIEQPIPFPYEPGLLSFREVPVLLAALAQLQMRPDLLICDGHGYAHPRRFGLACHLGIVTGLPVIGVAKTHFIGHFAPVALERGQWQPLQANGETIGAVLRTQDGVRPIYVSVGHRVSLETAVSLVLRCSPRYRLPETIRQADHLARNGKTLR